MVEIILAASIFALLVTVFVGAFIFARESTALAGSRARAVLIAEEGLEATRNIRDGDFASLTDGNHGLDNSSNNWNFNSTSDVSDVFTRQIAISTIDANTKQVVANVTWQQNAQRTGSVALTTRLTNWLSAVSTLTGGLLFYGDGTTTPKYRAYDSSANTFGTETGSAISASGQTFVMRVSPTKTEAIAGYVTSTGVLNVMCFNGLTWSQEWTANVGGTGTTRRFDIAYETTTGDVMVLYSTNTATTNELAYRSKPGNAGCRTAWSGPTNLDPIRTSGIVQWVKMAWDRRAGQNLITAIWADANSDLSAMVWSGSAWGNEPSTAMTTTLEVIATAQDVEDFDVEYESLSGDLMVVWSNVGGANVNTVRYRICTGGLPACTWSAITTPPTFRDDATNLDISVNPNTDEIVFASIGNAQSDLQLGYWSGSAWTNTANTDTSCNTPITGSKLVSTGWLISGATTRSVVVYQDQGSNNVDWYVGNAGTFTKQTDAAVSPSPANPKGYLDIQMNPLSEDQLMYVISDNANDLFAKRLAMTAVPAFTWTNSDGTALETTLPQKINSPFAFAYWRQ